MDDVFGREVGPCEGAYENYECIPEALIFYDVEDEDKNTVEQYAT